MVSGLGAIRIKEKDKNIRVCNGESFLHSTIVHTHTVQDMHFKVI